MSNDAILPRLPGVDMMTLSQRRAISTLRNAHNSAKTIRECDYDAKVRMMSPPSTKSPFVITTTPPRLPYAVAAFVMMMLLLGGLVLRSNVEKMAASWPHQAVRQRLDMGTATAASSSEWRDDVSEVEVKP